MRKKNASTQPNISIPTRLLANKKINSYLNE